MSKLILRDVEVCAGHMYVTREMTGSVEVPCSGCATSADPLPPSVLTQGVLQLESGLLEGGFLQRVVRHDQR